MLVWFKNPFKYLNLILFIWIYQDTAKNSKISRIRKIKNSFNMHYMDKQLLCMLVMLYLRALYLYCVMCFTGYPINTVLEPSGSPESWYRIWSLIRIQGKSNALKCILGLWYLSGKIIWDILMLNLIMVLKKQQALLRLLYPENVWFGGCPSLSSLN